MEVNLLRFDLKVKVQPKNLNMLGCKDHYKLDVYVNWIRSFQYINRLKKTYQHKLGWGKNTN